MEILHLCFQACVPFTFHNQDHAALKMLLCVCLVKIKNAVIQMCKAKTSSGGKLYTFKQVSSYKNKHLGSIVTALVQMAQLVLLQSTN